MQNDVATNSQNLPAALAVEEEFNPLASITTTELEQGCLAVALELINPVRLCTCASVETDMFGLVVVVVVAADTGLLPVSHTVPL